MDKDKFYKEKAEAFINGVKTGQSMASDFAQYDEQDWENEKERMIEHYKEEAKEDIG